MEQRLQICMERAPVPQPGVLNSSVIIIYERTWHQIETSTRFEFACVFLPSCQDDQSHDWQYKSFIWRLLHGILFFTLLPNVQKKRDGLVKLIISDHGLLKNPAQFNAVAYHATARTFFWKDNPVPSHRSHNMHVWHNPLDFKKKVMKRLSNISA